MPEFTFTKYRIPVVDKRIVFLCTSCGRTVELESPNPEMDIYESPDCICASCRSLQQARDSDTD